MMTDYTKLTPELLLYCIKINPNGKTLLRALKTHHNISDENTLVGYLIPKFNTYTGFYSDDFLQWPTYESWFLYGVYRPIRRLQLDCKYFCNRITK